MPEIIKTNVANVFLSTKSPFEFVHSRCGFTKVILYSKSWCEMFLLKHPIWCGEVNKCLSQVQNLC